MQHLVIKISGKILSDHQHIHALFQDISALDSQEYQSVLVHGAGVQISEYCNAHNIPAEFNAEGMRITNKEEMQITDMVLSGSVHASLLRACTQLGIAAVGLSGMDCNLVLGRAVDNSHTGTVASCNTTILDILTAQGILPIVNSVSATPQGMPLNINADEVAMNIAQHWHADNLIFISDTPGVMHENTLLSTLTPSTINEYQAQGVIHSGMRMKTNNAVKGLQQGIATITIGDYTHPKDLLQLIQHKKGTKIFHETAC